MKALLLVCILAISAGCLAHPHTSLEDLEGVWGAPVYLVFISIFTEQGPGMICRDQLTPECIKEIPQAIDTVVIEKNTISINSTQFDGASTPEKSAELYPACAASGVLPLESIVAIQASEITGFDPKTGRFSFVDARRPNDTNCFFVTLKRQATVPSVTIQFTLSGEGTIEQLGQTGLEFKCERRPGLCEIEQTENGLSAMFYTDHELPCVAGSCLDTAPPLFGSKFHFIFKKVKG